MQDQELNKIERIGMENTIKIITYHISRIDNNIISDECVKDLETLKNIIDEFKSRGIDTQNLNDISSAEQVVYHTTKE